MKIIDDVACTVCGCVCDDIRVHVEDERIVRAERACALAEPWYLGQHARRPAAVEIDGRPATWDEGVGRAVEILAEARSPLFFGLSRSSTAGQRSAVALADWLGGVVDTTASLCHAPSIVAVQGVGESTCSLGEVRNRSDLVIYWGCDPAVSHPRHQERYAVEPAGEFLPAGRAGRTVVVADQHRTASAEAADVYLPLDPEGDFDALWTLRGLVRGVEPLPGQPTGAPLDALRSLADRMRTCRSGVVFFGLGLSRAELGHLNVTALLTLVRDLHQWTRFYARRMRVVGDVTGADAVLCWQTGYPFSVDLRRGYPRYNPGEFSAEDLLERREVDACVFVGSEAVREFTPAARRAAEELPCIVLDHPAIESAVAPAVRFTTGVYGIDHPGTAYRMDEVPLPLRACLTTPRYPSDDAVLDELLRRLGGSAFGA